MRRSMNALLMALMLTATGYACSASNTAGYGAELQGFPYPYPIQHFTFVSQGQNLQMSYMDVPPAGQPNGRTAVLMHGKNFCGATWETTISALTDAGYRVVVPDQIGFCASSKPAYYQYSFQQLSANTMSLLKQLGITHAILVGH
ncbi:MAG: Alpha/beta hydrolase fold protein, partial [Proteobacteria bacterium]|nr:Alpha/beta hydrolase fold protein [Pseudomonadota bacterium]